MARFSVKRSSSKVMANGGARGCVCHGLGVHGVHG
jgi:hypothetical protein